VAVIQSGQRKHHQVLVAIGAIVLVALAGPSCHLSDVGLGLTLGAIATAAGVGAAGNVGEHIAAARRPDAPR
jgi:hypothetical protein